MHTILKQSVVKPENDTWEDGTTSANEDYLMERTEGTTKLLAISDGAGGSGIFSSAWAETLCENLPSSPITDIARLDSWLSSFWESFYEKHLLIAEKVVFSIKNKFVEEGSNATLLALWLDTQAKSYQWMSYGDSCCMLYDTQNKSLQIQPYQEIVDFERNPFLINWSHEKLHPEGFFHTTGTLIEHQCLILASDALAQYLLIAYQADKDTLPDPESISEPKLKQILKTHLAQKISFTQVFSELCATLESPDQFRDYCYQQYASHRIKRDDYSLIILKSTARTNPKTL